MYSCMEVRGTMYLAYDGEAIARFYTEVTRERVEKMVEDLNTTLSIKKKYLEVPWSSLG